MLSVYVRLFDEAGVVLDVVTDHYVTDYQSFVDSFRAQHPTAVRALVDIAFD